MMPRNNLFLALALSLSVASACDEAAPADFGADGDISVRSGFGNGGLKLNTSAIGDHLLHELNTRRELHEDVVLDGVYLKRVDKFSVKWLRLDTVWVEKGQLFGRIQDVVYTGADLHGSRWDVLTYGGGVQSRHMFLHSSRYDKVDDIHKYTFGYPNDPTYGLHLYSGKKGHIIDGTQLQAACGKDEHGSLEAVLYEDLHVDMKQGSGQEMPDLINIACDDGGVGKAGIWGYRPYDLGVEGFIAGVRMVRADYCGDGDSWTKPGTAIGIQDVWGINKYADPDPKTEAFWTENGAACVYAPRSPEFDASDIVCNGDTIKECKHEWELADVPEAVMRTMIVP